MLEFGVAWPPGYAYASGAKVRRPHREEDQNAISGKFRA